MGLTVFFCFTGKRFVKVDPDGKLFLSTGPSVKPFSTSLIVAAKRLLSVSKSPELWTVWEGLSTDVWNLSEILTSHAGWPNLLAENSWSGKKASEVKPSLNIFNQVHVFALSKSHNFFPLRISAILGLSVAFRSLSLAEFSVAKVTHLLISSVLSIANWWIDFVLMYSAFCLASFGKRELWSVGWPSLTASATNSSGRNVPLLQLVLL